MRRALVARLACALAAVLLLPGCQAASPQPSDDPEVPREPVIAVDFADPDLLLHDGVYYAYATNANLKNVQVATSTDLQTWQVAADDAFPELPSWAIPGKTWAPEVSTFQPGVFVLYFTATDFESGFQCIGTATASSPLGPFVAHGEAMLVCPTEAGGAIDASIFTGDGHPLLVWKNDGNCCGHDTWLQATPLTDDGLALAGPPQRLVKQTQAWEGNLVEAPTLTKRGGTYVLLYSANSYGGDEYATGFATAPSLAGPWSKNPESLVSTELLEGEVRGPGGQDLIEAPDGTSVLVVHGWNRSYTARNVYLLPLTWRGSIPEVKLSAR